MSPVKLLPALKPNEIEFPPVAILSKPDWPIAILPFPSVKSPKVSNPKAILPKDFDCGPVKRPKDFLPIAILLAPWVKEPIDSTPRATLLVPVVRFVKAL